MYDSRNFLSMLATTLVDATIVESLDTPREEGTPTDFLAVIVNPLLYSRSSLIP